MKVKKSGSIKAQNDEKNKTPLSTCRYW